MTLPEKNRNESYHALTDELGERQAQVLTALVELQKATNRDLSLHLNLPINSITGRCKELREKGYVIDCGTVFDDKTERNVTVFKAVIPITEDRQFTEDEVYDLLMKERQIKRDAKRHPDHVLRYDFFGKYGKEKVRPAILNLIGSDRITYGNTINDIYFKLL